jgi:precorrin-6y C5,15-methyltransferase (decarboxylating) CbiE subunit
MIETLNPIVIIGCGPGGPEYVTPLARQAAGEAQVLVGAARLFGLFPESPAERVPVTAGIDGGLDRIAELSRTRRVAVLVTGDPGLMSLAAPVIRRFGPEQCRIIPGISALQVACARLGLDWQDLIVIDAHGADPGIPPSDLMDKQKIAVLAHGMSDWIRRALRTLAPGYRVHLCQDLTLPEESVSLIKDGQMPEKISSLSILVFVKENRL